MENLKRAGGGAVFSFEVVSDLFFALLCGLLASLLCGVLVTNSAMMVDREEAIQYRV